MNRDYEYDPQVPKGKKGRKNALARENNLRVLKRKKEASDLIQKARRESMSLMRKERQEKRQSRIEMPFETFSKKKKVVVMETDDYDYDPEDPDGEKHREMVAAQARLKQEETPESIQKARRERMILVRKKRQEKRLARIAHCKNLHNRLKKKVVEEVKEVEEVVDVEADHGPVLKKGVPCVLQEALTLRQQKRQAKSEMARRNFAKYRKSLQMMNGDDEATPEESSSSSEPLQMNGSNPHAKTIAQALSNVETSGTKDDSSSKTLQNQVAHLQEEKYAGPLLHTEPEMVVTSGAAGTEPRPRNVPYIRKNNLKSDSAEPETVVTSGAAGTSSSTKPRPRYVPYVRKNNRKSDSERMIEKLRKSKDVSPANSSRKRAASPPRTSESSFEREEEKYTGPLLHESTSSGAGPSSASFAAMPINLPYYPQKWGKRERVFAAIAAAEAVAEQGEPPKTAEELAEIEKAEKERQRFKEIGRRFCELDLMDFAGEKRNEKKAFMIASRGEEILATVRRNLHVIHKKLGEYAVGTIFEDVDRLADSFATSTPNALSRINDIVAEKMRKRYDTPITATVNSETTDAPGPAFEPLGSLDLKMEEPEVEEESLDPTVKMEEPDYDYDYGFLSFTQKI